jgi:hypothetical protein
VNGEAFDWDDIPRLAEDYRHGHLATYFPIFRVNDA